MTSEMLSQEEIDALLKGEDDNQSSSGNSDIEGNPIDGLTDSEKDTLGEIGNISMGTAATTLFTLLGQKVVITTPKVSITNVEELAQEYPIPFVAVDVKYKIGLQGTNLLILKSDDVKVITDLMMGGDGTSPGGDISEMDLSAISEAMNQMVGSSSTSLSEMFMNKIDIDPPRAFEIKFNANGIWDLEIFDPKEDIVKVSFKMEVGNVIDSEIMQLIPMRFAKNMVNKLMGEQDNEEEISLGSSSKASQQPAVQANQTNSNSSRQDNSHMQSMLRNDQINAEGNNLGNNSRKNVENDEINKQEPVNVQEMQFQAFDSNDNAMYNEGIERIQDIPVEITVELGRTVKRISEILEYGPGTIIELDKLVGEPLEIYANGKFIARGEVVVIDDNFGVRVTDIINPSKRINKL
ncbi:MAG: flagellar motor switch phosphatase FliY [Firmicutes bacterium]|nr:flagellar motor switch phosphatase FliY [Bacillota bacterium]